MEAASFFVYYKNRIETTIREDEKDIAYSPTKAFAEETP
jgi:hypothetical protein